ncbi:MAG: RNA polymerase sigma factor [Planctomycetota bacterium]
MARSENPPEDEARSERAAESLLARFAAGDDTALGEIVELEGPRLRERIAARLPAKYRARLGASDIVQLTALELVSLRHRFENLGPTAFRAYLDQIAEYSLLKAIERERAQKRSVDREAKPEVRETSHAHPGLDGFTGDQSTPSQALQRTEGAAWLQRAFARLAPADQEILVLLDYEDVPLPEAAKALGLREDATRQRHRRAVARLREQLRRLGIEESPAPD